jgi:hypothetical protein
VVATRFTHIGIKPLFDLKRKAMLVEAIDSSITWMLGRWDRDFESLRDLEALELRIVGI